MALSSPGIGSSLDVNSIVSQLMAAESRPLALLKKREAGFQAKLSALGTLKGALSAFQTAAKDLGSMSKFQATTATSGDEAVVKALAAPQAVPGTYRVHVSQLAQAQTIVAAGQASATSSIGSGAGTTLTFQFGRIEGGNFVSTSSVLSDSVASNGIPANSLAINGITIDTDTSVKSAQALADRINLAQSLTGVTASVVDTGAGNAVRLTSPAAVTISGANPAAAGLAAGVLPHAYEGATFSQDASRASGTVTIDHTNNTLQGIRDAINQANIGVTATIVSDGSAHPQRLVISSGTAGVSASMKISVSGDPALSGLLAYDPAGTQNLTQTSAAQNTLLSVNGISISSASTSVNNAIQGVTLNASKAGSAAITVSRDTASVTDAVNAFVKSFNDVNKTLKDLSGYNMQTRQGSPLAGDAVVRSIQTKLRQIVGSSVGNTGGALRSLSDIGISFQKDGTLAADSEKLQKAIANHSGSIGELFAASGRTSDSLVSFRSFTSASKPGNYEVYVSALATQGKTVGSSSANLTITSGQNDRLSVTVDGVSAEVMLAAGSYTISDLVSHVQSTINGHDAFSRAGTGVKVSADANNKISITSTSYGSSSKVVVSGNGADSLLGIDRVSADGQDVAGSIGGVSAAGSGQDLTGAQGSAMEGLRIRVTGGMEGAVRGTLSFSQGYAYQLDQLIQGYLAREGIVTERSAGLNSSIKDIDRQRDALNHRLEAIEARYRAQFAALDTMISSMNKTSSFLQQQLSNLQKMG